MITMSSTSLPSWALDDQGLLNSPAPTFSGTGGHGNGGVGSLANEGVGNGADAPPPGQDYNFNDEAGTGPGNAGAQGGNGYIPDHTDAAALLVGVGSLFPAF